jgi:hypothetical protein
VRRKALRQGRDMPAKRRNASMQAVGFVNQWSGSNPSPGAGIEQSAARKNTQKKGRPAGPEDLVRHLRTVAH